eukprot:gene24926-10577_t
MNLLRVTSSQCFTARAVAPVPVRPSLLNRGPSKSIRTCATEKNTTPSATDAPTEPKQGIDADPPWGIDADPPWVRLEKEKKLQDEAPKGIDADPPWVRREKEKKLQDEAPKALPWGLYLLFSCFVAIACVGSIFEYQYGNPIFGVIQPDNFLWAPILLGMGVTGLPTAGFLFYKGITAFNEDADRQNKLDGYN